MKNKILFSLCLAFSLNAQAGFFDNIKMAYGGSAGNNMPGCPVKDGQKVSPDIDLCTWNQKWVKGVDGESFINLKADPAEKIEFDQGKFESGGHTMDQYLYELLTEHHPAAVRRALMGAGLVPGKVEEGVLQLGVQAMAKTGDSVLDDQLAMKERWIEAQEARQRFALTRSAAAAERLAFVLDGKADLGLAGKDQAGGRGICGIRPRELPGQGASDAEIRNNAISSCQNAAARMALAYRLLAAIVNSPDSNITLEGTLNERSLSCGDLRRSMADRKRRISDAGKSLGERKYLDPLTKNGYKNDANYTNRAIVSLDEMAGIQTAFCQGGANSLAAGAGVTEKADPDALFLEATRLFELKDYAGKSTSSKEGWDMMQKASDAGNPKAGIMLAKNLDFEGWNTGNVKLKEQAQEIFLKLAQHQDKQIAASAAFFLGVQLDPWCENNANLCSGGTRIPANLEESGKWFEKASRVYSGAHQRIARQKWNSGDKEGACSILARFEYLSNSITNLVPYSKKQEFVECIKAAKPSGEIIQKDESPNWRWRYKEVLKEQGKS